jgi:hypothetical protein
MLVKLLNQFLRQETSANPPHPRPPVPPDAGATMIFILSILRRCPPVRRVIEHDEARRTLEVFLNQESSSSPTARESEPPGAGDEDAPLNHGRLWQILKTVPREVNWWSHTILGEPPPFKPPGAEAGLRKGEPAGDAAAARGESAAVAARASAAGIFRLRCRQLAFFWIGAVGFGALGVRLAWLIWDNTFKRPDGEPFSLTSGTSAWPAEVVRLLVIVLAIGFGFGLAHNLREVFLTLTRRFRFSPAPTQDAGSTERVCAQSIWHQYGERSRFKQRLRETAKVLLPYGLLLVALNGAFGNSVLNPGRGEVVRCAEAVLLAGSLVAFILLALLTVDAAYLCRGFIEQLSAAPTLYPKATRIHFSRQMGRIDDEYLDEWIDLQLIAELTEQVGKLVYYPAGLIFLLLLARNSWWDCWSWPVSLLFVFALNFILALVSVIVLQSAAGEAKRKAEESMKAKIKKLQAQTAPTVTENNKSQAEKLLDEIVNLDRGAFVPFWRNPVVGAIFLSSGGTTILQLVILFMGR